MSGRHVDPAGVSPRLRRLGGTTLTALTATAVAGLTASLAAPAAGAMPAAMPAAPPAPALQTAPAAKPVAKPAVTPPAKDAGSVPSLAAGRMAVAEARKHLGAPYRYGADGPKAFDCSGLTKYAYEKVGVSLPRSAAAQQDAVRPVAKNRMQPGDLIFQGRNAYHVAMYAGNGKMITAPQSGESVKVDDLPSSYTVGRP